MQQIGSAFGRLFLVVVLGAAGYYMYNLYKVNKATTPKRPTRPAAASVAKTPAPGTAAKPATPAANEPPRRSAVDLVVPLQDAVYQISEAFVREYFGRGAHIKFPRNQYHVLGNRDFGFFTVLSTVTGRDESGKVVTLPWKARVHWRDDYWHLYAMEVGGKPVALGGVNPKLLTKRGKDPQLYDDDRPKKPTSATSPKAPPESEKTPSDASQAGSPEASKATPPESSKPGPPEPVAEAPKSTEEPAKPAPASRTWTDSTGTYKIEAEFISATGGKVKLRKPDGSEIELPMDKLSQPDQEWIKSRGQ